MMAVLLVLLALFVLCAPFLLTVRNADLASAQHADRVSARLALDSAARHARASLGASHPAADKTPYTDSLDELDVTNRFSTAFLDANDANGVMWDLDVADVTGKIDLNSAPPQVIANLTGCVSRLRTKLTADATELPVHSTSGFAPEGLVWVGGELIAYGEVDGSNFKKLARELNVLRDADGNAYPCGPRPKADQDLGEAVIDERAWAVARWRIAGADELRGYDAIEQVGEAAQALLRALKIPGSEIWDGVAVLERTTTVFAGVRGGATWQHAARLVGKVEAGPQNGCRLQVDGIRWFNPGTTVRISDGRSTEYGIVRVCEPSAGGGIGEVVLMDALVNDYEPYAAEVRPLARRPVNVNTATPEVLRALFLNLQLRGRNSRLTAAKADELVAAIVAARPFEGFEDFLRRVVLPSAGLEALPADGPVVPETLAQGAEAVEEGTAALEDPARAAGFLTESDAVAVYKNALNANDAELLYSTLPLCFDGRDLYELDLRASVNAPTGVERVAHTREQVELVVPQRPLMQVWGRQEDFDLALRLEREAPGWVSGPEPTARFDPLCESDPPSEARAHLGPHDTSPSVDPLAATPTYTFASREEDGWVQLAASRTDEVDSQVALRRGHVLHFDDERRDPEGRYLPDGTIALSPDDPMVEWQLPDGLLQPLSFSMWIKPQALEEGARFFDLGGRFPDTDRVALLLEDNYLVLRVLDGAGDHPESPFREWGEARYPLAGQGAGMPLDTWIHVQADVRGNRPDQITLLVDGRASAETPGLTRLSGGIGPDSGLIPVESTEGFPDEPCVLRIGNELVEAVKNGPASFLAQFSSTGPNAGFGGRQARERFTGTDPGVSEATLNTQKDLTHPTGTSVQLYGYSMSLADNLSPVEGPLVDPLGPFAVGRITGIVRNGADRLGVQMEPILLSFGVFTFALGYGMDSRGSDVEGLIIEAVDPGMDITSAFNRSGGYALLLGLDVTVNGTATGAASSVEEDVDGARIGGMELLHYTSWDGSHLRFDRRGDAVPELKLPPTARQEILALLAGRASWVFDWDENNVTYNGGNPDENMVAITKIIPLSVPVRASAGGLGFPVPVGTESEFLQLVPRAQGDADKTEWVRYDEVVGNQYVRSDPEALIAAYTACLAGQTGSLPFEENPTRPTGPGGGGGPGQTNLSAPAGPPPLIAAPAALTSAPAVQSGGPYWQPTIGELQDKDYLVSRSVRTHLQFRGVLGTFAHAHGTGDTVVVPVWRVNDTGLEHGWPGRFDHVMLMDFQPDTLGWPGVVQHAHRPFEYTAYGWNPLPNLGVQASAPTVASQDAFLLGRIYVAMREAASAPIAAGGNAQDPYEQRTYGRVTLFPSGERPREVVGLTIGGDFRAGRGDVPSAVVDEAVFGTTDFGEIDGQLSTHGAQLVLQTALGPGAAALDLVDDTVRGAHTWSSNVANFLGRLAQDAGLLRIGQEILCYDSVDPDTFFVTVPNSGRGLLGSEASNHAQGEVVTFLNSIRASVLAGGIGENDAFLPLVDAEGFPPVGTVLIDDELVHYTRVNGATLEMPSASETAGAMDGRGAGIFRGRYGTLASGHAAGTPVILVPFRYWDRWADRADAPELHYFNFSVTQPNAFWRAAFWDFEAPAANGPRLGVLQRTDPRVPWDGDPENLEELEVYWDGVNKGDGNAIGTQSDRIDWRVFVRHDVGSYDAVQGLSHGWKTTPRLRFLGVEYLGPGMVLRRVDR